MATGDQLLNSSGGRLRDKIIGLFQSKRAIALVVAAALRYFGTENEIDPATVELITQALLAWVAGDTIRATGYLSDLLKSSRFWLTAISIGTTVVAPWLGISAAIVSPIVTAISILVLGKSWREMGRKSGHE